MKRIKMKNFTFVVAIAVSIATILVGISLYTAKDKLKNETIVNYVFSKKVEQHRPLVEHYAKQFDVEEHVDLLLAMMMQESGGRGNDPMQASESLCGKIGCIDDPEKSIEQGVYYFSETLKAAEGDIALAVQSYNFGLGFIQYAKKKNEPYSEELAIQFSQEMYEKAEDKSIYSCLREEAKQYNACYGDIYYAKTVLSYRELFAVEN